MDEDKYTDKQVCDILSDNHFSNLLQYVFHMFGTMPGSMAEEEIIQYLKMNKTIGIVFKFMPEEVKDWCRKYSKKLCWYDVNCWSNCESEKRLYNDKVYTLSEDYKHENPEQIKDFDKIKFLRNDIKMTEQEIVLFLKENKTSGMAVGFLPEEVREWVYIQPISIFRFFDGKEWIKSEKPFIRDNDIICLPDNYKLKKLEKTGGWVEFEVDENGCYRILDTDMRFHWSEWNKPMWIYGKDENRSWYLTAFGGWQYKNYDAWYMYPMILLGDDRYVPCVFKGEVCDVKQAIPVKIRFWREYK